MNAGHVGTAGTIEVVRAGALTTVQDLGRPGLAHLGVPRSGALDLPGHLLANRLVGNPATAATLETTLTGVAVRCDRATLVAVTGASAAVRCDRTPVAWGAALLVPAGAVLDVGPARHGVRSYVALAGGVAAEPVLGSRSTDLLSGLGPARLATGDVLPLGPAPAAPPPADALPTPATPENLILRVRLGPRDDWFLDPAGALAGGSYTVSTASNRIALRVAGPALRRADAYAARELPSEGMVLGAVQVPADGQPIVFLADHPTTGGYPVIGVVGADDLAAAAQARPGTPVRFTPVASPG
ncbi:biotin-dependent carboxyltransferase family protein [Longispora sp. K20-0274]|uniref:5-oxoprolinase subunit C family protein n=1 Tax=Longispora sp. K20-0274 TaxID=3088255 RepID=UPI00399BC2E4